MKHLSALFIMFIILLLTTNTQAQLKIKQGDELFVKEPTENLRLSPSGSIICQLPQGTRLIAIEEQGNWVAVCPFPGCGILIFHVVTFDEEK